MKVWVTKDCVACGLCVDICPEVFDLGPEAAVVKAEADIQAHAEQVRDAAEQCPVAAIIVEE